MTVTVESARYETLAEVAELIDAALKEAAKFREQKLVGTALIVEHLASLTGLLALGRVTEAPGLDGGMKARDRALESVLALRREAATAPRASSVVAARELLATLHRANRETKGAVKHEFWEILRHPAEQTGELTPAPRGLGPEAVVAAAGATS